MLHLYQRVSEEHLRWSDAICTALQLANFWQDVASDLARDRIYLPLEDLARFGVAEDDLLAHRTTAAFRALMRFETARTRALLESGRPLARALPWRLRLELGGVLAGGHWVLDAIDAVDGDVFRRRPALAGKDWLRIAAHAVVPPRRHRAVAARASA
jgi:phytoene/squalene synthetase